jgi:DNA-binding FadR family transcriptional regulator
VLLEGCGNHLLCLAAQPVLHVLRRSIAHEYITQEFRQQIKQQHQRIAEAISDRDADSAGREMEMHLKFLRPAYDLIGHHTHTPTDGARGTGYLGRSDL